MTVYIDLEIIFCGALKKLAPEADYEISYHTVNMQLQTISRSLYSLETLKAV